MKKYVLTKEGVVFLADYPKQKLFVETDNEVVKVADSLEEIADTFVIEYSDGDLELEHDFESVQDICKGFKGLRKPEYVYYAVKTDRGLLYIATFHYNKKERGLNKV